MYSRKTMYVTPHSFGASMRTPGAVLLSTDEHVPKYLGPTFPKDEAGIIKQDLSTRPQCVYSLEDFKDQLLYHSDNTATYTYAILENDDAVLLSCETNSETVVVPDKLNNHIISNIASNAFYKLSSLVNLTLPNYAECIGRRAIFSCNSLKKIILPQEIDLFSSSWIKDVKNIETIVLPRLLKFFPAGVFNSCSPKFLEFGSKTRFFAPDAFVNSTLEKIYINPQNKYFSTDGHAIYSNDKSLLYALATPLESYTVNTCTHEIMNRAFAYVSKLKTIKLPDNIFAIHDYAFMCSGLEIFETSKNLEYIGAKAFLKCINLKEVVFNNKLKSVDIDAFEDTCLTEVTLPESLEQLGFHAFWNSPLSRTYANNIHIDSKNEHIYINNEGSLYRKMQNGWVLNEQLDLSRKTVIVDDGTYGIAKHAFARITQLEEVVFPDSLREIEDSAFYACTSLRAIVLPPHLKIIGEKAFCLSDLRYIHIPASVQKIGSLAFSTYKNSGTTTSKSLEQITIDKENKNFFIEGGLLMRHLEDGKLSAIAYAGQTEDVVIPQKTTTIEAQCFAGVHEIKTLYIPKTVKYIQPKAFSIEKAFRTILLDLPYNVADVRMYHTPLGPPKAIKLKDCKSAGLIALKPIPSTQLRLDYPQSRMSIAAITYAFLGEKLNPASLVHYLDAHVSRADNLHFWAIHMLQRLHNPVLLDEAHAQLMRKRLTNNLDAIVSEFAKNGTTKGFELLFELDFFTSETIQKAIDISSKCNNAHSTSFLLELQQKHFTRTHIDFDI